MIPYPPNFSKIAAKIIDPAIGASTWALGNHKCVENIGSFTNIPINKINHIMFDLISVGVNINIENIRDIELCCIYINIINIGRDAVIVYIIKYIPACIRSGWYPQYKIINSVGIREASNHT